jgi:hypothetical protein
MHDILRERILRKLNVLPEAQLYQVLDYMEFLESKYAPGRAMPPDALQRFAERLEDGMRVRNVAPKVISGTVGLMGTARKVIRSVTDTGKEILDEVAGPAPKQQRPRLTPGKPPVRGSGSE